MFASGRIQLALLLLCSGLQESNMFATATHSTQLLQQHNHTDPTLIDHHREVGRTDQASKGC
jgi:hypothetical protein